MPSKLGVIGGGVMAEAIFSRLLASGTYTPAEVFVSEPAVARQEALQQQYGVVTDFDNKAAAAAPILLLAVKPQILGTIAPELANAGTGLAISILAGTPLARLEAVFPQRPVVRAMPNTNATVGASVTAIAGGTQATPEHLQQARAILAAVGAVVEVPENLLDAVTGLSGSGPAYVALAIEALADGGVAAGLPRAIAQQLATETVLGTARQVAETGLHPAQLKDRVTSPGGTTIAGIAALERGSFRSTLMQAVLAAARRSQELGQ
ncbi:MAG: pyrroline-5-carboxylate reductase [Cyanobacteria bacterium J06641_5]